MIGYPSNSDQGKDCYMAFFVFLQEGDNYSDSVSCIAGCGHSFVRSVGRTVGG